MVDSLIHLGNALYFVAYAVKDILWLRIITVVGAVALSFAFYMQGLTSAIGWEVVFGAVNIFWIVLIIRERRPVRLSDEEDRLRELAFKSLTAREMKELLSFGYWRESAPGEVLIEEDVAPDRLLVLYSGKVDVSVRGEIVSQCGEGTLIGEVSFLTDSRTTAKVTVSEPTRYVWWRNHELRSYMEDHAELRTLLLALMGADTASKLASR